ncbi:MAG: hypothetical protein ACI9WU_002381 [Myxococcota bacterium]|jgi:hypothetical protein
MKSNIERMSVVVSLALFTVACGMEPARGGRQVVTAPPASVDVGAWANLPVVSDPDPTAPPQVTEDVPGSAGVEPSADRVLLSSTGHVDLVGFSGDGVRAVYHQQLTGLSSNAYILDTETGETRLVDTDVIAIFDHEPIRIAENGSSLLFRKTLNGGAGSWHSMNDLWAFDWGTGVSRLLSPQVVTGSYQLTPDGRQAVYVHTQARRLFVADVAGTAVVELATGVYAGPGLPAEQTLPISPDGSKLAYMTSSNNKEAALYLVDLGTMQTIQLSASAYPRSARFLPGGGLEYLDVAGGGSRLVQYDPVLATQTVSEHGTGWVRDQDSRQVAHLVDGAGSSGELRVWNHETGLTVSVDSAVRLAQYAFGPSSETAQPLRLAYVRNAETVGGGGLIGELWVSDLAAGTRTRIHTAAYTDSSIPFSFTAGGEQLVFRTGPCSVPAALHVWSFSTNTSTVATPGRTCQPVIPLPDGSGLLFHADPELAMELEFDTGTLTELASGCKTTTTSANGGATVHTLHAFGSPAQTLLVTNWNTGGTQVLAGASGAQLVALTDTHVVWLEQDAVNTLHLTELPN